MCLQLSIVTARETALLPAVLGERNVAQNKDTYNSMRGTAIFFPLLLFNQLCRTAGAVGARTGRERLLPFQQASLRGPESPAPPGDSGRLLRGRIIFSLLSQTWRLRPFPTLFLAILHASEGR